MKYLLYYNLDSKFVSDQINVGGDGTNVVSVVDGVAWTNDQENVYYRYVKPDSENLTSYTITIHYKDINGDSIAPDDVVTVDGYVGKKVSETITAKSISGYTILSDDVETLTMDVNIEHTFAYGSTSLEKIPLTFRILSGGTIRWRCGSSSSTYKKTIQYRKNGGTWTSIISNTGSSAPSIPVVAGDVVEFKGDNDCYYSSYANCFSSSTPDLRFNAYGNIMSLIDSTDFENLKTLTSASTFYGLFSGCTSLVNADGLLLPATTLGYSCYRSMFKACTSLTSAPELPATRLTEYCYYEMFSGCTSLTSAPNLPATNLPTSCYESMFRGCTSLTRAPEIQAFNIGSRSCADMFHGCTNLIYSPSKIGGGTLAYCCCVSMFSECTNLTTVPELPSTGMAEVCYNYMFWKCTNITKSPELPATTLTPSCYHEMFYGCSKLNYITCLATTNLNSNYLGNWVSGVASTGTFVKNPNASSWTTGVNGIPANWTVQNAS